MFLISVMGCSANLSKYARHLLGNNAGANPSIISTKPKANNKVSVINHLQTSYLGILQMKKPAILLAFIQNNYSVIIF